MKTQTNKQFEGASNIKIVKHKKKLWEIKTRREHSEHEFPDQDYQSGKTETKEGTLHQLGVS